MTNAPLTQRRIVVSTSSGTLSVGEVVTDASGNAAVTLTAPSLNTPVSSVSVSAAPVTGEVASPARMHRERDRRRRAVRARRTRRAGRARSVVHVHADQSRWAKLRPSTPSGSLIDGVACGNACSYSWDFGGGNGGTGILIQFTFTTTGVQTVTLTVATWRDQRLGEPLVHRDRPAPPVATFSVLAVQPHRRAQALFNAAGSPSVLA